MGADADRVAGALCDRLADARPELAWATERRVGGTPVDVVGRGDDVAVLVELEWRRADPSDNAAKLFRHLAAGELDAGRVLVVQLFTPYYDLASGGVSAKRRNAEFVGERAAAARDELTYRPLALDLPPPKRGEPLPEDWRAAVDAAADEIAGLA